MDGPTRTAYVMAVVAPAERAAAASFTAVPRSLAAALSPTISQRHVFRRSIRVSLPLVACGVVKIAYDLALWRGMRGGNLSANRHPQPRRTAIGAAGLSITNVSRLAGPA